MNDYEYNFELMFAFICKNLYFEIWTTDNYFKSKTSDKPIFYL
jgi:hypothetical protein